MIFCDNCGSQTGESSKFCGNCGQTLAIQQAGASQSFAPPDIQDTIQQMTDGSGVSAFTPPSQQATATTYAPQASVSVPVFNPPKASESATAQTAAPQAEESGIPVFTPPVPTFTPPARQQFNGPACFFHDNSPAAARCVRCGKNMCHDCCEMYGGLTSGQYAGQMLCYDCTQQMVSENVDILKENKSKIMFHFILTLVGMVFGAIIFGSITFGGMGIFLGAVIGGCFWTFIRNFFSRVGAAISGSGANSFTDLLMALFVGCIIGFVVEAIASIVRTTQKVISHIVYLVKTSKFIEEDSIAMQQMRDYMEYSLIVSHNAGVDLETLMAEDSQLYNNSYANLVRNSGEAQAAATLQNCVTTIAANGEIIRSFAA